MLERVSFALLLSFLAAASNSPRPLPLTQTKLPIPDKDQILFLSQSILNGFNKPRPGSRTILSTIDFPKAFDSVWHPALFHKLISAGLPPCFARWTQSFLSDRRLRGLLKSQKPLLSSLSRCSARIRSWPCTFLSLQQ